MNSDEEYLDEFEMSKSDDSDDENSAYAPRASLFQFLTAAEILALMNEELKNIDLIVEVSAIYLSGSHREKCYSSTIRISHNYIFLYTFRCQSQQNAFC